MRETGRLRGIIVKAVTASALILGTVGIAAVPASAIGGCQISMDSTNATIGVQQMISVDTCADGTRAVTVSYANGSAPQTVQIYASGDGNTSIAAWSPNAIGAATLSFSNANPITANVSPTATLTTIAAPSVATVGQATKILVNVQSASPSAYQPLGKVVVTDATGNPVQTLGLTAGPGNGNSYAYWWWTPPTAGSYSFLATYQGNTIALSSPSQADLVFASASGNTISITAPGTMTVGVPVTLTATLVPSTIQGSVGFTFNGKPISASIQIVNGSASMQWTPTTAGAGVIGASYTTNGGASGSTSDKVNIVNGPAQQDVITLTQPGWGTWAPNGQYNLPNGTSTTMTASTLSGSPVTLTETGPCSVSGLTITVPVASGQCNIQASSPGGRGYAPVTYGYTVLPGLGNQTATLAAPMSGKLTKGRTYVLESPGQVDTNAGQNITWTVTKGNNSVCKLGYPADGSVTLKMLKKGACNVKGTAPGVPNQWNPYVVTRSYKG